jgi:hypothetical protein
MYHTTGAKKSKFGQAYDVCDKLLANHGGKNHHLVVDNYYTSIDLAQQMLLKEIYITGTIRRNRRNLPPLVQKKSRKKGEITAVRKGQMLALSWVDHKQVRLISTFASAATVEITKRCTTREVPNVITEYNAGMGGIDVSDQMTDHYGAELGTVKCWHKVVFHLFDRTVTNAYICYKNNINDPTPAKKKMTHLQFMIRLVEGLIGGYEEPRTRVGRPSLGSPEARLTARHFLETIPDKKRKKCVLCAEKREVGFKGSHISTWCKDCGVGLCKACFPKYNS